MIWEERDLKSLPCPFSRFALPQNIILATSPPVSFASNRPKQLNSRESSEERTKGWESNPWERTQDAFLGVEQWEWDIKLLRALDVCWYLEPGLWVENLEFLSTRKAIITRNYFQHEHLITFNSFIKSKCFIIVEFKKYVRETCLTKYERAQQRSRACTYKEKQRTFEKMLEN